MYFIQCENNNMSSKLFFKLIVFFVFSSSSLYADLKILCWNVESGGNNSNTIAAQLEDMPGYDIYGLREVKKSNLTSDHRPIECILSVANPAGEPSLAVEAPSLSTLTSMREVLNEIEQKLLEWLVVLKH